MGGLAWQGARKALGSGPSVEAGFPSMMQKQSSDSKAWADPSLGGVGARAGW